MSQVTGKNLMYAAVGTGILTAVELIKYKEAYPIETFFAGTLGAYVAQTIGLVFARWKANLNHMTPDTYLCEFLIKPPSADLFRITGIVAGIAVCKLLQRER